MIKSDLELKECRKKYEEGVIQLKKLVEQMKLRGTPQRVIEITTSNSQTILDSMAESIALYERLINKDYRALKGLTSGQILTAIRVMKRIPQSELADRLNMHQSAISRYERNDYEGISQSKYNEILEALGASFFTTVLPENCSTEVKTQIVQSVENQSQLSGCPAVVYDQERLLADAI